MADTALQFDGSQNYLSLGTMGNFGSSLGSGFYAEFNINTSSTSLGVILGTVNTGSTLLIQLYGNANKSLGLLDHGIGFQLRSNIGSNLSGAVESPTINFNDGNTHKITLAVTPASNTIAITIDGVSQTVVYNQQQTPANWANFGFPLVVGGRNNRGTVDVYFAFTVDNLKIGNTSGSIVSSYLLDEGTGISATDSVGSNTGTLSKGAGNYPAWVTGLFGISSSASLSPSASRSPSASISPSASSSPSSSSSLSQSPSSSESISSSASISPSSSESLSVSPSGSESLSQSPSASESPSSSESLSQSPSSSISLSKSPSSSLSPSASESPSSSNSPSSSPSPSPEFNKNAPQYFEITNELSIMLGFQRLSYWNTAGRPASPTLYACGVNFELEQLEIYFQSGWKKIALTDI